MGGFNMEVPLCLFCCIFEVTWVYHHGNRWVNMCSPDVSCYPNLIFPCNYHQICQALSFISYSYVVYGSLYFIADCVLSIFACSIGGSLTPLWDPPIKILNHSKRRLLVWDERSSNFNLIRLSLWMILWLIYNTLRLGLGVWLI